MITALIFSALAVAAIAYGFNAGAPMEGDCRCTHEAEAHKHYRDGTDCSRCDCRSFRR